MQSSISYTHGRRLSGAGLGLSSPEFRVSDSCRPKYVTIFLNILEVTIVTSAVVTWKNESVAQIMFYFTRIQSTLN